MMGWLDWWDARTNDMPKHLSLLNHKDDVSLLVENQLSMPFIGKSIACSLLLTSLATHPLSTGLTHILSHFHTDFTSFLLTDWPCIPLPWQIDLASSLLSRPNLWWMDHGFPLVIEWSCFLASIMCPFLIELSYVLLDKAYTLKSNCYTLGALPPNQAWFTYH
jgi:hypothetical protein